MTENQNLEVLYNDRIVEAQIISGQMIGEKFSIAGGLLNPHEAILPETADGLLNMEGVSL